LACSRVNCSETALLQLCSRIEIYLQSIWVFSLLITRLHKLHVDVQLACSYCRRVNCSQTVIIMQSHCNLYAVHLCISLLITRLHKMYVDVQFCNRVHCSQTVILAVMQSICLEPEDFFISTEETVKRFYACYVN
jgi:hypothetical protein